MFLGGVSREFAKHVVMYFGLIGGETLDEVVSSFVGVLALRAMGWMGWLGCVKAGGCGQPSMDVFESKGLDVGWQSVDGAAVASPIHCVGIV